MPETCVRWMSESTFHRRISFPIFIHTHTHTHDMTIAPDPTRNRIDNSRTRSNGVKSFAGFVRRFYRFWSSTTLSSLSPSMLFRWLNVLCASLPNFIAFSISHSQFKTQSLRLISTINMMMVTDRILNKCGIRTIFIWKRMNWFGTEWAMCRPILSVQWNFTINELKVFFFFFLL